MTGLAAPKWLRREAVLILHDESLADHGGASGIRDEGLFDSALARPENLLAYAFGIIRNHPFVDGNKRTGFLAAAVFLEINGWMLVADEVDATVQTFSLAASEITEARYADWLRQSCERL